MTDSKLAWARLDHDTAPRFEGATIEARRNGGDIEHHECGVVYRSMGMSWLQIGGEPLGNMWCDGLLLDGQWEVRTVGPVLHKDARAFV